MTSLEYQLYFERFKNERSTFPHSPKLIREAVDQLASETWEHREDPEAIKRLHEIRALSEAQLQDDIMTTAGRGRSKVGRSWIMPTDRWNERYQPLARAFTPEQLAFQAGIEPLLGELTGEDRVLIRWTYDQMLDQRTIARMLHVTQPTVHRRLANLHGRLKARLEEKYLRKEEPDEEPGLD